MRLIDADALKPLLREYCIDDDEVVAKWYDIMGVDEVIDRAPTIYAEPCWIPCEERLPESTQEVLVTGINGCVYTSRIVHGEFEYGGNVIAWMPLPEPYKGERKDDE